MPNTRRLSSTIRLEIPPELIPPAPAGPKRKSATGRSPLATAPLPEAVAPYHHLLQGIYDAVMLTDAAGCILEANERAGAFFRCRCAQLVGRPIVELISGAPPDLLPNLMSSLSHHRYVFVQGYCARPDHSVFAVEIAVSLLKLKELRILFLVRDITVRRQAEEQLRQINQAVQNASDAVLMTDREGRVSFVNPAGRRLWNCPASENLVGTEVGLLWAEAERAQTLLRTVLQDHQSWSGELRAACRDGATRPVQVAAACNRDADDVPTGMVLTCADLTDRKQAESAMREAERQRVLLASLGTACHHLGQPVTVLLANTELLLRLTGEMHNPMITDLLGQNLRAAEEVTALLRRFNSVADSKTVPYLASRDPQAANNQLLDISD